MDIRSFAIKAVRKVYRKLYSNPSENAINCSYDREYSNQIIRQALLDDKPCMISRIGSGEMGILTNYMAIHSNEGLFKKIKEYIVDDKGLPWWDTLFFKSMRRNAGIFPESIATLEAFSEVYMHDIPNMDIIGSFNAAERYLPLKNDIIRVHLECLYPFFVKEPWTEALKNKKVLVVHPFEKSIQSQYINRKKLFKDDRVLPEYELLTIKAVQSNANNKVPYQSWFEALQRMKDQISACDFDICIIGCGAYGLPLASHVKNLGKKAVHLGGGSQLLFGIKGARWDNNGYHWPNLPQLDTNYSSLYNEFWVRPLPEETPNSAKLVEGACYW